MKKLNIGCGDNPLDGWINVDIYCIDPRVRFMDATEPFPFESNSIDRIFSEHMLEHLPFPYTNNFFCESFRVLKPGGRIRISIPNLNFLIKLLRQPDEEIHKNYISWAAHAFNLAEDGENSLGFLAHRVFNNFFYNFSHRFMWSPLLLRERLRTFGFEAVSIHAIKSSADPEFQNLENDSRMPPGFLQLETMTLEAEKPNA